MNNKEDIRYVYALVSQRIKLFRKYRGITQEQLAEETTFSRGLIGNIESVKTSQAFSLAVLYAFARALNIPLELFVKEDIDAELDELGIKLNPNSKTKEKNKNKKRKKTKKKTKKISLKLKKKKKSN